VVDFTSMFVIQTMLGDIIYERFLPNQNLHIKNQDTSSQYVKTKE